MKTAALNRPAPDFTLLDQYGKPCSLKDYEGRWLVVYFYPDDRSLNCTREACYFRDEQQILAQFGNTGVVGINKSSVATHKRFSDRNHLNFPILSDPGHVITEAYGAWRSKPVKWHDRPWSTRRNTYLVNPKGKIVKEYLGITPSGHVETIIHDLQVLQGL
jgi:peroxiredoxin Q/BCP